MKQIKDIRIYKSDTENISGNPHPVGFAPIAWNAAASRIAMKLREQAFSLGDFDHLYLNLTTCPVAGGIAPAKRAVDRYYPWYRWYDVEITQDLFDTLDAPEHKETVFALLEQLLQTQFASPQFDSARIHDCVSEALTQGEKMLMRFKEKQSVRNQAVIYLRYLDNARYLPLLRVFDADGQLLLETDLPEAVELGAYGEIRLSSKRVTIMSRKNAYSASLAPMTFLLP